MFTPQTQTICTCVPHHDEVVLALFARARRSEHGRRKHVMASSIVFAISKWVTSSAGSGMSRAILSPLKQRGPTTSFVGALGADVEKGEPSWRKAHTRTGKCSGQ